MCICVCVEVLRKTTAFGEFYTLFDLIGVVCLGIEVKWHLFTFGVE